MRKNLRALINCNRGEGYIALILVLMCGLILFGGLYYVMSTSIALKQARRSVDLAAEEVFAEIRESGYQQLIKGSTDYINNDATLKLATLSDDDIFGMFQAKVNGTAANLLGDKEIRVEKASGGLAYTVSSIDYTYIDDASKSANAYDVGDVNRDGLVNADDITAINAYIADPDNSGVAKVYADVNVDDVVDAKDIALVTALIDYPLNFKDAGSDTYTTSTSKLVITLHMSVPMYFGDLDFGTAEDDYSYVLPLSFKAAG